jgi:hypothetical protein
VLILASELVWRELVHDACHSGISEAARRVRSEMAACRDS